MKISVVVVVQIILLSLLVVLSQARLPPLSDSFFDVLNYGAIGDGSRDDTQAFKDAWNAACKSSSSSPTMVIPHGFTFLLQPVTFQGHCRTNNVHVQVDGKIVSPGGIHNWKCSNNCDNWLIFRYVNGLYIYGSGSIDGRGSYWWRCNHVSFGCHTKPTAVKITDSDNVHITGINFIDSPLMHLSILQSNWVYVTNVVIKSPEDSPNTDGVHIQRSRNIFIDHSNIGTGDDCISIGGGSSHVRVSNTFCGPGHGISIGSLGKGGQEESVEQVYVSHVDFRGTSNGARIKTWQGGKGYARAITFEHINIHDAKNPIIIDQYYCDPRYTCKNQTSAVQISNVRFRHFRGTSMKENAMTFACSETIPCTDIVLEDIVIKPSRNQRQTASYCLNAYGSRHGEIVPQISCLG